MPNFELWLLLHFEDIQAPLNRVEVMRLLKKPGNLPTYDKGMNNTFAITRGNLEVATRRAERLAERYTAYDDPEPYTGIFDLVKLLTTLNKAPT